MIISSGLSLSPDHMDNVKSKCKIQLMSSTVENYREASWRRGLTECGGGSRFDLIVKDEM
jgi:hypothetical protein